ncbi:helix-turn-helix domain-containing protein [Deinococcus aetherius]|nr:helix-turn-helix transcriptional regulator [Deinococcus aetherius]
MYAMAMKDPPFWAQALKARREALGLSKGEKVTQEDIAARTGDLISQRTVSHLENGSVDLQGLAFGRVVALAKALNWTLPEFQRATGLPVEEEEVEPPESSAAEEPFQLPAGLQEAIEIYGQQHKNLRDPVWQRYLAGIRWRSGQPTEPDRWFDAYRDLVRNGIVPGED